MLIVKVIEHLYELNEYLINICIKIFFNVDKSVTKLHYKMYQSFIKTEFKKKFKEVKKDDCERSIINSIELMFTVND